jgi:hypothetical protein
MESCRRVSRNQPIAVKRLPWDGIIIVKSRHQNPVSDDISIILTNQNLNTSERT